MFTRIVSIVVLIAFALTTAQCAPTLHLPRERIPRQSTCITTATLDTGEEIRFAAPGAHILGRSGVVIGRATNGEERRILIRNVRHAILAKVDGEWREEREVGRHGLLSESRYVRTDKVIAAELASGETTRFPGLGGWIAGPPWVFTGRDESGVWREIALDDVTAVQVKQIGRRSKDLVALAAIGGVALVVWCISTVDIWSGLHFQ
jgi:hypothetical protein